MIANIQLTNNRREALLWKIKNVNKNFYQKFSNVNLYDTKFYIVLSLYRNHLSRTNNDAYAKTL